MRPIRSSSANTPVYSFRRRTPCLHSDMAYWRRGNPKHAGQAMRQIRRSVTSTFLSASKVLLSEKAYRLQPRRWSTVWLPCAKITRPAQKATSRASSRRNGHPTRSTQPAAPAHCPPDSPHCNAEPAALTARSCHGAGIPERPAPPSRSAGAAQQTRLPVVPAAGHAKSLAVASN